MTAEELIELVKRYGDECVAGGQGYTMTDEVELLDEIRDAVRTHWCVDRDRLRVASEWRPVRRFVNGEQEEEAAR